MTLKYGIRSNFMKWSAVAVTFAIAGATLTTVGSTAGASSSKSSGGQELANIISSGTVRVADCLSFAPFGFYSKNGKAEGYDVDIAKLMAQQLGVKLQLTNVSADNRIPELMTNKVDAVICNFTENPQRATQVNFTTPYVEAGEYLLVKKSSNIKSVGDLAGKTVAVITGSTDATLIKTANPKAKVESFPNDDAAILAVKTGQVQAMVEDSNYLTYQAKINPSLMVTHQSLVPIEYNGFGTQQNQYNWTQWLNQFLFWLNSSGTNKHLYKKWFGVNPPYPVPYEG
jgi:polar amino acid transport system substrate-binding protein